MSIRDKILSRCTGTRRQKKYKDPVFGDVWLQSISEAERMSLEFAKLDSTGDISPTEAGKTTARKIMMCIVDEQGNRQFDDEDLDQLARMDAADAGPIREAIDAHLQAAKQLDVGAAKKN